MSTKLATAFLDRVQKSGLVSGERLSQLQQELETQGVDLDNPTAIAGALVDMDELTDWQAEKLLQGKHKGFFLGSYRLQRPLGKGGMGAVFLARHVVMRRQCAIKVLPQTQIQKHSSVLDRFILESQAVASLDHHNIVRAYDISKEVKDNKEIHYLVMEYVEGQDAQQMVQEHGVLDYVKAAEIIRQTANGLAHAHDNGLLHRDIKPANLLIDKKGVVKILDLGLARFFDDSETASLTAAHNETVLGTADYLSPEQALNSHDVDLRTDIYSLGCTAYFLLTGHPPFPDGTVAQRLVAHQVKQPQPITAERRDAPAELVAIVEKMMAKKPEDRFQSGSEISAALAAWLIKFGDEDWRRQHSEITADSAILKLLTTHREPTRAMASPMSETELELAPLDDDEGAAFDSSVGSGVRRTGSAPSSGSVEDDLGMVVDEKDEPAATAAEQHLTSMEEEQGAVHLAGALEELPTLDDTSGSGPLDDGLFGALPPGGALDSLGDLEHEDLGAIDSSPGLGALESDIRKMPVRSPSSSARQRKPEPAKPKTLWESVTSVGLPIIVGVVGGGLLVLIVLLAFFFAGSREPDPVRPGSAGTAQNPDTPEPDEQHPAEPEQQAGGSDQQVGPAVEPDGQDTAIAQADADGMARQQAADRKQKKRQQKPANRQDRGFQPSVDTANPEDRPQPVVDLAVVDDRGTPAGTQWPPDEPATTPPNTGPQPKQPTPKPDTQATKTVPENVEPFGQPLAAPQRTPDQILASLHEFALDVKVEMGDNKKAKDSTASLANSLRPAIERGLSYALRNSGLELVNESDTAVLHVTILPRTADGFTLLDAEASLQCRENGAEPITVWRIDKSEVMRFKPNISNKLIMDIWEEKTREFFRPLRTAREQAVQNAG
jgi:serine/threonine-protein kinase